MKNVKFWCPIHLGKGMLKEAETRWRKEGFCRNFIISNSNLGRIWPCLSQFWAKPNNPKHYFCYQQACKGSKSTKNTPVWSWVEIFMEICNLENPKIQKIWFLRHFFSKNGFFHWFFLIIFDLWVPMKVKKFEISTGALARRPLEARRSKMGVLGHMQLCI